MKRLFLTGIAVLLLATGAAHADDKKEQNLCFEIYRNTTGGPGGAFLINKCTGQTWILFGGAEGKSPQWFPLSGGASR
jgi:hypothetical protein